MTEYNPTFKIFISQVICLRSKHFSVATTKCIAESVAFFYVAENLFFAITFLFQMPYLLKHQMHNYK